MKNFLKYFIHESLSIIQNFFSSDMEIMTDEVKLILSNKKDTANYLQAIEKLRTGAFEVTIILHNGESITLI